MNTTKKDVAVFIDFENIYVSVREKFDATPNFEAIMERCEDYGRIVVARAYADWYRYPRITSALFANNIEPMYVPTYYYDKDEGRQGRPIKNSVDMHMCIDAMRTLYTRTNITTYVFITGDRDFIALVNCVRQEGKDVIIIGIGGAASSHLAQSADEFLFYEQIVTIRPMSHQGRRSEAPSRPLERVERPDRYDRDRNGRDERKRERSPERPGERSAEKSPEKLAEKPAAPAEKVAEKPAEKVAERPAEKPAEKAADQAAERPAPIVAIPVAQTDTTIYDKLVEALHLARKRGYVSSFGSLKVLMKELQPNFKETRYRDQNGKPFTKFTDFVREAERLGKIQIFTSGTVNEVFLPDEDPYRLSQFAEDLPSVEAERELEQELAQEAEDAQEQAPEEPSLTNEPERSGRRRRRRGPVSARTSEGDSAADSLDENGSSPEESYTFGEREWSLFDKVMREYADPVPFADIFNALRELRNSEDLDLTNSALKELIKQAINAGKVQRSNRGAKAHYRIVASPVPQQFVHSSDTPLPELVEDEPAQLRGPGDELDLPDLTDNEPAPTDHAKFPAAPADSPHENLNPLMVAGTQAGDQDSGQPRQELDASAPEALAEAELAASSPPEPAARRSPRRRKPVTEEQPAVEAPPKQNRQRKSAPKAQAQAETPPAQPASESAEAPKPASRKRRTPKAVDSVAVDPASHSPVDGD